MLDPFSVLSFLTQALQTWYTRRQLDLQLGAAPPAFVSSRENAPNARDRWADLLREILTEELPSVLSSDDPFSSNSSADVRSDLLSFTPFASRLKNTASLETSESGTEPAHRLGLTADGDTLRKVFGDENGVRVMFPPIQLGSAAIMYYLKKIAGFNIQLSIGFPHALDIVDMIARKKARPFDACILGEAPAIQVLNDLQRFKLTYSMAMPSAEQRVLAPLGGKKLPELGYGEYYFIKDRVSTLLEHVEMMEERGDLKIGSIGRVDAEPDRYPDILAGGDGDPRIVVWSPHWQVYVKLGLAQQLEQSSFLYRNLMFTTNTFAKRFPRKAKLWPVLIRDAWIRLRRPDIRARTIEAMVADSNLLEAYWRFCGLHRIPGVRGFSDNALLDFQ